MHFSFGTMIKDREVQRALRSVRPAINDFKERFGQLAFKEPLHESLFMSLVEGLARPDIESKDDEFFQIMLPLGDDAKLKAGSRQDLLAVVADRIHEALLAYPFCEKEDRKAVERLFVEWKSVQLEA